MSEYIKELIMEYHWHIESDECADWATGQHCVGKEEILKQLKRVELNCKTQTFK